MGKGRDVEAAGARDAQGGAGETARRRPEAGEERFAPGVGPHAAPVTVLCVDGGSLDHARGLSDRLAAPFEAPGGGPSSVTFVPDPGRLYLKVSRDGLSLMRDAMELRPDFAEMLPRIKQGVLQREMLVKAARVRGVETPRAVDATAGLGEDSLLLAAAGFTVTLCEADPVIAALLEDALARASVHEVLGPVVARMHVVAGDSRIALERLGADPNTRPDVVYLDPMFPGRVKSAAVKKKFQLIHGLECPTDPLDEELLLRAALAAHPRKIVIKRPVKGPYLAGAKPSHSIAGKAVRYDCIVPPR